jgi:RNA polymerase sigma-70 factor (ECF subfamily)
MSEQTPITNQNEYQNCWQAVRNNEENGLYRLYHAEYDRFYRYGMLSAKDPVLVKSAINTTFVNLWAKRHSLPEVENIRGYLFIWYKRQLFHELRQSAAAQKGLAHDPENALLTESSYEDALVNHELDEMRKAHIRKAMSSLTERQRTFIQLRFFEELSFEEIAEQTNTSVRTVYNTLHTAINRLRVELGDAPLLLAWLALTQHP